MDKLSDININNLYIILEKHKIINILKDLSDANKYINGKSNIEIKNEKYINYYDEYYCNQDSSDVFCIFKMENYEKIIIEDEFGNAICKVISIFEDVKIVSVDLCYCDEEHRYVLIENYEYKDIIKNLISKVTKENKYFIGKLIDTIISYNLSTEKEMKSFEDKYAYSEEKMIYKTINSLNCQISIYDNLSFDGQVMYKKLVNKMRNETDKTKLKYWFIITLLFSNNDVILIYQAYLMVINGVLNEMLEQL